MNNRNFCLTVLEPRLSRIKVLWTWCLARTCFLCGQIPFLCNLVWWKTQTSFLDQNTNLIQKPSTLMTQLLHRACSLYYYPEGWDFSMWILRWHKHSDHSRPQGFHRQELNLALPYVPAWDTLVCVWDCYINIPVIMFLYAFSFTAQCPNVFSSGESILTGILHPITLTRETMSLLYAPVSYPDHHHSLSISLLQLSLRHCRED